MFGLDWVDGTSPGLVWAENLGLLAAPNLRLRTLNIWLKPAPKSAPEVQPKTTMITDTHLVHCGPWNVLAPKGQTVKPVENPLKFKENARTPSKTTETPQPCADPGGCCDRGTT